jgi:hypothetical protein
LNSSLNISRLASIRVVCFGSWSTQSNLGAYDRKLNPKGIELKSCQNFHHTRLE